jgi:uncharacterized Zn-binding protein involved in type VI secretion
MGKPSARLTDMTAHGGTIMGPGVPTVMVGKMPAATILDNHVCPMVTGVVPHVGGPMTLGSMGVFIGKKPAGRVGDLKVCVGPPSLVMMGCFTVLIGEAGGGSGGSAGSAAAAEAANFKGPASIEPFPVSEPEPGTELHYCNFQFTDSAGLPLAGVPYKFKGPDNAERAGCSGPGGEVLYSGFTKAGSYKVTAMVLKDAKWSKAKAPVGEEIELTVAADGFENGTPGAITITKKDDAGVEHMLAHLAGKVEGKQLKAKWKIDVADAFEAPVKEKPERKEEYCQFMAYTGGSVAVSGKLEVHTDLDIEMVDEIGQPLEGEDVEVLLSNGEVKAFKIGSSGKISIPSVPANTSNVSVGKPAKTPQWPINIKGNIFYNRTWKYNTSTVQPAKVVYLACAKTELFIRKKGAATLTSHGKLDLTDTGLFKFSAVPECDKVVLRVYLEHSGNDIVVVKGLINKQTPDMELKTGSTPWCDVELDMKLINGFSKESVLGDVRIKNPDFSYICDSYMTIRFGNKRIEKLTGFKPPRVTVNFPEALPSTSFLRPSTGELHILDLDSRDRDVILHEYGHFIAHNINPKARSATYGYNDDVVGIHEVTSKEHYEPAWNEAIGTFLSCVLSDDPVYRDGYDTKFGMTINVKSSNFKIGHHNESTILQALWELHSMQKHKFKTGIWEAWTNKSKRTVSTSIEFYDNWKELGLKDLANLVAVFKNRNMEFGYRYLDGSSKFTAAAPPKKFNLATKEFTSLQELYTEFSKPLNGSRKGYMEEFYNRNKEFNPGSLDPSSTIAAPIIIVGKTYLVPKLIKLS